MGGGPATVPGAVGKHRGRTTARTVVSNERQTVLVLCCLKPGGARVVKRSGVELVFLQVPGFKKLQAFLHGQAFLQALGETKDKTAWDGAGGSGELGAGRRGDVSSKKGRGWPSQRD